MSFDSSALLSAAVGQYRGILDWGAGIRVAITSQWSVRLYWRATDPFGTARGCSFYADVRVTLAAVKLDRRGFIGLKADRRIAGYSGRFILPKPYSVLFVGEFNKLFTRLTYRL